MKYDRNHALLESSIPGCPAPKRGKVRDLYDFGDSLLLVATDRISAFDVIMPNPIPAKGRVLTALSEFWFKKTRHIVENHFVTSDFKHISARLGTNIKELRGPFDAGAQVPVAGH